MQKKKEQDKIPPIEPANTPEGRENQLIALAYSLVEERLRNGTASAQETVHFLKLGTQKERYELEKLKVDMDLQRAKIEAMESAKRMEEKYAEAIEAMRRYTGSKD